MFRVNNKTMCSNCFTTLEDSATICSSCGYTNETLQDAENLSVGSILKGNYVVGKILGRGGFGITYLGYDIHNDRKVAIKEYFPVGLAYRNPGNTMLTTFPGEKGDYYQNGVEKFYDEAKTISRFNGNPNIINVYEFFYENNTAYYVMEYVSGIDLKKYIEQNSGRLHYKRVLKIMQPVLNALIIIHSVGVLHRDISPDNIYLADDGEIKLIDFGAARQVIGEESRGLSVILKQGFAPFEQYQKKGKQGPWSDIYALGATMYYAITGKQPEEAMSRVEQDALKMPSQMGIMINAVFEKILVKMLAVRIEDRYQSIFELKYDIDRLNLSAKAVTAKKAAQAKPEAEKKSSETYLYSNIKPNVITALTVGFLVLLIIINFACTNLRPVNSTTVPSVINNPTDKSVTTKPASNEYKSVGGRFSILFPKDPKEEKQTTDTDVGSIDSYSFTVEDKSIVYMVTYNDYPADAMISADVDTVLDGARDGALNSTNSKLISETKIQIDGYSGREIKAQTSKDNMIIVSRIYLVKNRLYQILALATHENCDNSSYIKFFNSFKLAH